MQFINFACLLGLSSEIIRALLGAIRSVLAGFFFEIVGLWMAFVAAWCLISFFSEIIIDRTPM